MKDVSSFVLCGIGALKFSILSKECFMLNFNQVSFVSISVTSKFHFQEVLHCNLQLKLLNIVVP